MKLEPVQSSNIAAVGYEPDTQTLGVQFKSGGIYHYSGVSPGQHQAFIGAESVGKHFQTEIRDKFPSVKANQEQQA